MQDEQPVTISAGNCGCPVSLTPERHDTLDSVLRNHDRAPLRELRRRVGGRIAILFSWYRY
jgi:hypothetical protein